MKRKFDDLLKNQGRRRLLLSSGGVLALPFLESIASRPAVAQSSQEAPLRLLVFYSGHGLVMDSFLPQPGFTLGSTLAPVADAGLAEKLLVIGGVDQKVDADHWGNAWSCLSCRPKVPWGEENWQITGGGPSVEHVIGTHLQNGGRPRRLDLALDENLASDSVDSNLFWAGADDPLSHRLNLQQVFDELFPQGAPKEEPEVDLLGLHRRSVLDGVLGQFQRLQMRVSSADRLRLEQHADKVRALESGLESAFVPNRAVSVTCESPPPIGEFEAGTHRKRFELNMDLLAHAMACNLADIGTFRLFDLPQAAFDFLSDPNIATAYEGENYHGAWHRFSDSGMAVARDAFVTINQFYGSMFARLLSNLDQFDEGAGTALDSTMVLWITEYGHGGGHAAGNLAVTLAGHAGGAALGRYVNFSQSDAGSAYGADGNPGIHNLAVTMLQAFGIAEETFGDYENVQGPVSPGPLDLA